MNIKLNNLKWFLLIFGEIRECQSHFTSIHKRRHRRFHIYSRAYAYLKNVFALDAVWIRTLHDEGYLKSIPCDHFKSLPWHALARSAEVKQRIHGGCRFKHIFSSYVHCRCSRNTWVSVCGWTLCKCLIVSYLLSPSWRVLMTNNTNT